jgi:EpsI family protein
VRELWAPDLSGERGRLNVSYRPKNGATVSVYRAVYEAQRGQNRMLRFGNRFYPDSENISAKIETRTTEVTLAGRKVPIFEYKMPERIGVRVIRTYYQIGQTDTASPYRAKLHLATRLLSGQGDRSTVVVWSAYALDAAQARAALTEFESAFGDQLARREP